MLLCIQLTLSGNASASSWQLYILHLRKEKRKSSSSLDSSLGIKCPGFSTTSVIKVNVAENHVCLHVPDIFVKVDRFVRSMFYVLRCISRPDMSCISPSRCSLPTLRCTIGLSWVSELWNGEKQEIGELCVWLRIKNKIKIDPVILLTAHVQQELAHCRLTKTPTKQTQENMSTLHPNIVLYHSKIFTSLSLYDTLVFT